jgi:hypothetical protein
MAGGYAIHICGAIGETVPIIGVFLVAGGAGVVTLYCILSAARCLIRPGETDLHHPKHRVLAHDR